MARRKLPIFTERTLAETKADQIDQSNAFASKLEAISCKEGCSNCCRHAVHVTIPEGVLAYQTLAQKGLWTPSLRKRLEAHAERTWDLSSVVWHLANIVCPLLEKDRCTIYDARPFACRVTVSTGDPYYCHPHQVNAYSKLVPKREALEAFYAKQGKLLRRHNLDLILLPLSKAILLGEKIATGSDDIEDFIRLVVKSLPNESETPSEKPT